MGRIVGLIDVAPKQEEPKGFSCPHCGKEFKSEAALKAHCKKEHPDAFDNSEK